MKYIILTLCVLSFAFAQDTSLEGLWESWKLQYNKDYADAETEAARFKVFTDNHAFVEKWNSEGNTAVLALNKFADLTAEEFAAMYTGLSQPTNRAENSVEIKSEEETVESYPSSWNWVTEGAVTAVKDQGQCGSCWAYAPVVSIEGIYKIQGHPLTAFSEQQAIDCDTTNAGCNGGWPNLVDSYYSQYGIEPEKDYPDTGSSSKCKYNASEAIKVINGTTNVTKLSPTALFASVYEQPVVVITVAGVSVFQMYSSGIITTGCTGMVDFSLTAVGYTPEYFILKNSWGTDWGQQGFVWISSSTQYNAGTGACHIFSDPSYPTPLASSEIVA